MKTLLGFAWSLALVCSAASAAADSVLERISAGGKLVIAHRESSVPFSYVDAKTGKPVGYAVDLCLRMAEVVRKKTGMKEMQVEFLQVTPANRISMIEQGKADLIRKMVQSGLTVCLIEHKMNMIMSLADKILVLSYGEKIAEGTPAEIRANPAVIDAYLGSEHADA